MNRTLDPEGLLRSRGIRPTSHRVALTHLLFDGRNRHVTAEQVYHEAHEAGIPVALATVYNTLNQLRTAGLLSDVVVDASRVVFDTNTHPHWHVFNETTGELTDVEAGDADILGLPPLDPGLTLDRVDVIVRVRDARIPLAR
ncbi:MAG TPA: transcriptional repressor [Myxococcota bacterium]|nr:transcriptional repressor [Myxococcota bacterium]